MDSGHDSNQAVALVIRPGCHEMGRRYVDLLLIDRSCHESLLEEINTGFSSGWPYEAIRATADGCREAGVVNIIVDLVHVDRIDAIGLGAMIALLLRAKQHNGGVVLANLKPRPADVMVMTKLDQVLPNVGSVASAVEYLLPREGGVGA